MLQESQKVTVSKQRFVFAETNEDGDQKETIYHGKDFEKKTDEDRAGSNYALMIFDQKK